MFVWLSVSLGVTVYSCLGDYFCLSVVSCLCVSSCSSSIPVSLEKESWSAPREEGCQGVCIIAKLKGFLTLG